MVLFYYIFLNRNDCQQLKLRIVLTSNELISQLSKEIDNNSIDNALSTLGKLANNYGLSFNVYLYAGVIDYKRKLYSSAIESFTKALEFKPNDTRTLFNLGDTLAKIGQYSDSITIFKKVLAQIPDHIPTLIQISAIFDLTGNPSAAVNCCNIILKIDPTNVSGLNNLGNGYKNMGLAEESLEAYKKALEIKPNIDLIRSNLLFASNYFTSPKKEILNFHKEYASHWNRPILPIPSYKKKSKINIAYISGDFCTHSVAYFLEGVFSNHNREKFSITALSNNEYNDSTTLLFKEHADNWIDIRGVDDNTAYKTIIDLDIDIIIDLSGHTKGSRMGLLGLKPAPVIITWLGYPNTTGLETIDYRITDIISDPIENNELYTEELIRLENGFLSYTPPRNLPSIKSEFNGKNIVFGSFNNIAKLSTETINTWSKVLKEIDNSELIIKHKNFNDPKVIERYSELFKSNGIDTDRITFLGYSFEKDSHLTVYNRVTIALDTYPYNGTTTSFEALIMGVPVISLSGETHNSRVGKSILHHLSLGNLSASNEDDFIKICKIITSDIDSLVDLKSRLRALLLNSKLCNGKLFTTNLEKTYINILEKL